MKLSFFALLACIAGVSADSNAATITFDGLKSGEQVLSYYNGGFGSEGSGPGPNFGIAFTAGLAADSTVIAFGPSGLVANTVTMNLETPFSGDFSFYFVGQGDVSFYTDPNAAGTLLETDTLLYPPFFPFDTHVGPFQSVVFKPGAVGPLRVDGITLGGTVIPERPTGFLVSVGLMVAIGFGSLGTALQIKSKETS